MAKGTDQLAIPDEIITGKIYLVRDKKVMLDEDLAELYGVTTGNLNKAVNRNKARFPEDFMFQLTKEEFNILLFQIGRSSWGGRRTPPYAFTNQDKNIELVFSYFDELIEKHDTKKPVQVKGFKSSGKDKQ